MLSWHCWPTRWGRRIILVVEKLNELRTIYEVATRLKITPAIGIRIKLANSGSGKWEESGGDSSKFGLNSSELLEALDYLRKNGMNGWLKLIHFHIGSQITKIRRIKNALREAMQFYVQLSKLGFEIDYVDIGGGLGVDYDGTRSSASESSMNYSIQEYANDAIYSIVDACEKNGLRQPNIVTESGRSLTAHHSVLITEVLETTSLPTWKDSEDLKGDEHELVKELYEIWDRLDQQTIFESWHDALQIREEVLDMFSLGIIDLRNRALAEKLFWEIAREVGNIGAQMKHPPEELRKVSKMLPDKYFCNFSLFQSLPDSWAVDQVFPVIPITRLDEKPTRMATLQDMTCDSDGKIDNFIVSGGTSSSLPVHPLKPGEPYYIGVFLVGAYQEILGDMHNLFGDTNAVHISCYKDHYEIDRIIDGETVAEVLDYVQFNPKKLVRNVETWVTKAMKDGKITPEEGREFLSNYRSGLYGYTYLEKN